MVTFLRETFSAASFALKGRLFWWDDLRCLVGVHQ